MYVEETAVIHRNILDGIIYVCSNHSTNRNIIDCLNFGLQFKHDYPMSKCGLPCLIIGACAEKTNAIDHGIGPLLFHYRKDLLYPVYIHNKEIKPCRQFISDLNFFLVRKFLIEKNFTR